MLRTEVRCGRVTVQGRYVGDTGAGLSVSLGCCAAVIEAFSTTDFVGVPCGRSGVKVGGSRDGRGHRRGEVGVGWTGSSFNQRDGLCLLK